MYELTYALETIDTYPTFAEAFKELFRRLNEDLEKGTSWQMIETTIWIEPPSRDHPIMFYDAKDHAYKIGLLVDGKINEDFIDPEL